MLQRAASNAYSWWWASNVRTNHAKWLDGDLHEMEDKVKAMIKLIDEDADSFAKKAELYFRRRPELIQHVEEMYRAYKSLADRYDRVSGELHKANHTIAAAFPDQVQLEEDDDGLPKAITSIDPSNLKKSSPNIHHLSLTEKSKDGSPAPRKTHHRKITSHLSKEKAQEEIERLQKEILVLQTEKEFLKSSYTSGMAKYCDIDRQITEMQEEICSLQDAFSASAIIEDDEARALMVARAIKSCEDGLFNLQEQQKITSEEARVESERIRDAEEKLNVLKVECGQPPIETVEHPSFGPDKTSSDSKPDEECYGLKEERLELQSICRKIKEHFEGSSETAVVELAGNIDELVDKVIDLELTVSSQSAQIKRLRLETDELQKKLQSLGEDKSSLSGDSVALIERLKVAEEELQRIQQLEKSIQEDKDALRIHLTETCQSFNELSEKLQSPKKQDQVRNSFDSTDSKEGHVEQLIAKFRKVKDGARQKGEAGQRDSKSAVLGELSSQLQTQLEELDDTSNLESLLASGIEGKEVIVIAELTNILQNYKDAKKKLADFEKQNQTCQSDTLAQVTELKHTTAMKDEEIRLLKEILNSLQANINANAPRSEKSKQKLNATLESPRTEDDSKSDQGNQPTTPPTAEEKFRAEIDTVLEENIDFWLRFSTSYHQIQKFETTCKGLQAEIQKLNDIKSHEASGPAMTAAVEAVKQESLPLERRLRELNTDLQVWLEQNALLKGELRCRFSSLCSIQDEISRVTSMNETKETEQFKPYQAAKFQGEVLNMQLENNKLAKELQTGLDHVRDLHTEVGRALSKIRENFGLTVARNHHHQSSLKHESSKTRIPLRTFLFGSKPKKPSIFACMNPAFQKQHNTHHVRSFPS